MKSAISAIAAAGVFYGWMSMVGNPHVIETSIGIALALVTWLFVYIKLR